MHARVIPNVMEFENGFGRQDEFNRDLPATLGLHGGDIPLFQVTRIVRRKGIETAIQLIDRLGELVAAAAPHARAMLAVDANIADSHGRRARAATIFSGVIGRSRMRTPIAS